MLTNQLSFYCSVSLSLAYKASTLEMTNLLFVLCFSFLWPFLSVKPTLFAQLIGILILFYGMKYCLMLELQ